MLFFPTSQIHFPRQFTERCGPKMHVWKCTEDGQFFMHIKKFNYILQSCCGFAENLQGYLKSVMTFRWAFLSKSAEKTGTWGCCPCCSNSMGSFTHKKLGIVPTSRPDQRVRYFAHRVRQARKESSNLISDPRGTDHNCNEVQRRSSLGAF